MPRTILGRSRWRSDRGVVTVEFAVAIIAALVTLGMLLWGVFLTVVQIRCVDTAAEVARQAARGDKAAVEAASNDAPQGAQIKITNNGGRIVVEVKVLVEPMAKGLPKVPLHAKAEVLLEPGEG